MKMLFGGWGQWGHHHHHEHQEDVPAETSPFFETPDDIEPVIDGGVPTAVFHGLGDACLYGGMRQITKEFSTGTGAYAKCIEVGLPTIGEYLNNFETVAEKSCKKVAENKNFHGEFNVVGLS